MNTSPASPLNRKETFDLLGPAWPIDLIPQIQNEIKAKPKRKIIVLDDDPTGTQTIKNISVVTDWSLETLVKELQSDSPGFFILTNSRSMSEESTTLLHREIAQNIKKAIQGKSIAYTIVSRGDSTLRGHYPLETDIITEGLGPFDLTIFAPYFEAGGRFTINDIQYVTEDHQLIPVADTPYAKDRSFGYKNSHLKEWIEEKSYGKITSSSIHSISISDLRDHGPTILAQKLATLPLGAVCISNAACEKDIEVLALAIMRLESLGRRIIVRSAASFVSARFGQRPQPPLPPRDLINIKSSKGGLIVVGSHVPQTTNQLSRLLTMTKMTRIELNVESLLDSSKRSRIIESKAEEMNLAIEAGRDTVLYTSRKLIEGSSLQDDLNIGNSVSDGLVQIVKNLRTAPRYLIVKGGITSSDIATKGLGIRKANVIGQALPGVPVWKLGSETLFKGMNYILFPGNVGSEDALANLVSSLQNQPTLFL